MRTLLVWLALASCALAQTTPAVSPGKFPAVNVQVTVPTKQRNKSGSDYEKTMLIEPKVTIEGTSHMMPIPAAEAVMVIVTMDTKAKYKSAADVFKVHAAETLPIPEAKDGTRRAFDFDSSTVTFDTARDASNLGGAIYKYFVFGLRDAQSKEIVDFQTNNASLATFCKSHPEKRADYLSLKKGGKFPSEIK